MQLGSNWKSFVWYRVNSLPYNPDLLKTLWEKEKMLLTSIFSFSHNISTIPKRSSIFNLFPHNDTVWRIWERSLLKTLWEKEKLLVQAISPFPTMFTTLSKTEIAIFVTFNLSSANAFNLVWSKILSCWNGLSYIYLVVCKFLEFKRH